MLNSRLTYPREIYRQIKAMKYCLYILSERLNLKIKTFMRILAILQNAWGDRSLPITFRPNPYNKSAKVLKKMVGDNYYEFANTTNVVTSTASEHAPINKNHFEKVIQEISKFDLVLVGGRQAERAFQLYHEQIIGMKKPVMIVPHPASRSLSNARIKKIRNIIEIYQKKRKLCKEIRII